MPSPCFIHHLHNHKTSHHCASATIFSINTSKIKSTKSIKIIQIGFTIKKYTIWLKMKWGLKSKFNSCKWFYNPNDEAKSWVWKQMWFYRSQLWNIKLGRAPHVSRFMWKKTCSKTTTQLLSKTHSFGNVIFRHFDVINSFSTNLWWSILRYLGNEWVPHINKEPQYSRRDDPMMTWSLKFDQWLVMPEFGIMEQRLLAP